MFPSNEVWNLDNHQSISQRYSNKVNVESDSEAQSRPWARFINIAYVQHYRNLSLKLA